MIVRKLLEELQREEETVRGGIGEVNNLKVNDSYN